VWPTPEFATGPSRQLPIVHCYGYVVGVLWRICRLDPASQRGVLALRLSAARGRKGNTADIFLVRAALAGELMIQLASPAERMGDGEHEEFGEADTLDQEKRAVGAEYP